MNKTLLDRYNYARKSCQECLDNANTLVDMHGLNYWAEEVEKIRNEIRELEI